MDLSDYLSIALVVSQVYVVYVLRTELKSKSNIINDLKTFNEATSASKLAEYYQHVNELDKKVIIRSAQELYNNHIEQIDKTTVARFDEMASFIEAFLLEMPEEIQRLIVYRDLPTCVDLFKNSLKGLSETSSDKNGIVED